MRREKAIYHTLNKLSMDTSRKVLLAEAWCPLAAKPHVHEALRRAAQDSSTQVRAGIMYEVQLYEAQHQAPVAACRSFHCVLRGGGCCVMAVGTCCGGQQQQHV